jgi:hypothetical protein
MQRDAPVLAICYENGRMQLMRDLNDPKPVLVDAMMTIKAAKYVWSEIGVGIGMGVLTRGLKLQREGCFALMLGRWQVESQRNRVGCCGC